MASDAALASPAQPKVSSTWRRGMPWRFAVRASTGAGAAGVGRDGRILEDWQHKVLRRGTVSICC